MLLLYKSQRLLFHQIYRMTFSYDLAKKKYRIISVHTYFRNDSHFFIFFVRSSFISILDEMQFFTFIISFCINLYFFL